MQGINRRQLAKGAASLATALADTGETRTAKNGQECLVFRHDRRRNEIVRAGLGPWPARCISKRMDVPL